MPTKIPWTDETWPVVTGCTPCSTGCAHCYGARLAATRLRDHPRYKGLAVMHDGKARWTGKVNLNHDVLEQPLHWRKTRMVFAASMGDLFHPGVPRRFVSNVFEIINQAPQHIFQILTKRPQRMLEYIRWWEKIEGCSFDLDHVWLGTSIENQAAADERREYLEQCPAAVKFVSYEPALGPINWIGWEFVDQIISGGESGPRARPSHPNWHRATRDFCQENEIAYFFKQWGAWGRRKEAGITLNDGPFGYWDNGTPGYNEWVAGGLSSHGEHMVRVGKKRAGRLLDGQVWDQFPVSVP